MNENIQEWPIDEKTGKGDWDDQHHISYSNNIWRSGQYGNNSRENKYDSAPNASANLNSSFFIIYQVDNENLQG